ncbi:unnamed protein product [Sphagnum tenellum]
MRLFEIITPKPLRILDPHDAIAWDFDKTLIDNEHTPLFYEYIHNTPNKRHVIVTFRTHGMQDRMFQELAANNGPAETDFAGYANISNEAWEAWNADAKKRRIGDLKGPPTEAETYYTHWKGETCHKLGLSILVDDDIRNTLPGCRKFGVKRIVVEPGCKLSLQSHYHRAEHWVVVAGTARVTRDAEVVMVRENESIYLPLGAVHRLENPGKIPLTVIEVQSGAYVEEDDIIRFADDYGRDQPAEITG